MALRGKGMLVVFCEVKPRHERDLNEWYNREHIDERVNMPGFRRARRYVAVSGAPKYLATYECNKVNDLATPAYLAVLANQTPWSQAVMARFTRFNRYALRIAVDLTHGIGGAITTVRFVPAPARRRELIAWLRDDALPKFARQPGMLGGSAGEDDLETANAPAKQSSKGYSPVDEAEWVVMLEGTDAKATAATARALFKPAALKRFGVGKAPTIGTYRLLFGNDR
ncbi:MAG: hypothetical protein JOY81_11095 [Alphaproteobacteria bacterium]|nr:hypothetical protein [Alphaproteobacteria bacterium]